MNRLFALAAVMIMLAVSCKQDFSMQVFVSNSLSSDRVEEIVEISADEVYRKLNLSDSSDFIILDDKNQEVPYQVTYDGKVVFPANVTGKSTAVYNVVKGNPSPVNTLVYGRRYPERLDDIAWENDKMAYRVYGPSLQATGEKAYGYDILTKSVSELVIEDRYAKELDKDARAKIKGLKESGKHEEAAEIAKAISYHINHGNGMDCYAVGPTLGGGTAALMPDSVIAYPYCYRDYEILDNGPLRFTVRLEFNPSVIAADSNVVEKRIIQLDKGSYLNKTIVSYSNVTKDYPIAAGIVVHEPNKSNYYIDSANGYMSYADPTTNPDSDNGTVYVGVVFPHEMKSAKVWKFDKPRGKGIGHVLGFNTYQPGYDFIYYWGASWSKCGFDNNKWNSYLDDYNRKIRNPLQVTVR